MRVDGGSRIGGWTVGGWTVVGPQAGNESDKTVG